MCKIHCTGRCEIYTAASLVTLGPKIIVNNKLNHNLLPVRK